MKGTMKRFGHEGTGKLEVGCGKGLKGNTSVTWVPEEAQALQVLLLTESASTSLPTYSLGKSKHLSSY